MADAIRGADARLLPLAAIGASLQGRSIVGIIAVEEVVPEDEEEEDDDDDDLLEENKAADKRPRREKLVYAAGPRLVFSDLADGSTEFVDRYALPGEAPLDCLSHRRTTVAAAAAAPTSRAMIEATQLSDERWIRQRDRAHQGSISAILVAESQKLIVSAEWLASDDSPRARVSIYVASARQRMAYVDFETDSPVTCLALTHDEAVLVAASGYYEHETRSSLMLWRVSDEVPHCILTLPIHVAWLEWWVPQLGHEAGHPKMEDSILTFSGNDGLYACRGTDLDGCEIDKAVDLTSCARFAVLDATPGEKKTPPVEDEGRVVDDLRFSGVTIADHVAWSGFTTGEEKKRDDACVVVATNSIDVGAWLVVLQYRKQVAVDGEEADIAVERAGPAVPIFPASSSSRVTQMRVCGERGLVVIGTQGLLRCYVVRDLQLECYAVLPDGATTPRSLADLPDSTASLIAAMAAKAEGAAPVTTTQAAPTIRHVVVGPSGAAALIICDNNKEAEVVAPSSREVRSQTLRPNDETTQQMLLLRTHIPKPPLEEQEQLLPCSQCVEWAPSSFSHAGGVASLSVCSRQCLVVSVGSSDNTVHVWNYARQVRQSQVVMPAGDDVRAAALHPLGYDLALVFRRLVRVYHLLNGGDLRQHSEVSGIHNGGTAIKFAHGGHSLAVAVDSDIILMSRRSSTENKPTEAETSDDDGPMEEASRYVLRQTLTGHVGPVRDIAWSDDDRILVTCSSDGSVYCWDVATSRKQDLTAVSETLNRGHAGGYRCLSLIAPPLYGPDLGYETMGGVERGSARLVLACQDGSIQELLWAPEKSTGTLKQALWGDNSSRLVRKTPVNNNMSPSNKDLLESLEEESAEKNAPEAEVCTTGVREYRPKKFEESLLVPPSPDVRQRPSSTPNNNPDIASMSSSSRGVNPEFAAKNWRDHHAFKRVSRSRSNNSTSSPTAEFTAMCLGRGQSAGCLFAGNAAGTIRVFRKPLECGGVEYAAHGAAHTVGALPPHLASVPRELLTRPGAVTSLEMDSSGRILFSAGEDGLVVVWSVASVLRDPDMLAHEVLFSEVEPPWNLLPDRSSDDNVSQEKRRRRKNHHRDHHRHHHRNRDLSDDDEEDETTVAEEKRVFETTTSSVPLMDLGSALVRAEAVTAEKTELLALQTSLKAQERERTYQEHVVNNKGLEAKRLAEVSRDDALNAARAAYSAASASYERDARRRLDAVASADDDLSEQTFQMDSEFESKFTDMVTSFDSREEEMRSLQLAFEGTHAATVAKSAREVLKRRAACGKREHEAQRSLSIAHEEARQRDKRYQAAIVQSCEEYEAEVGRLVQAAESELGQQRAETTRWRNHAQQLGATLEMSTQQSEAAERTIVALQREKVDVEARTRRIAETLSTELNALGNNEGKPETPMTTRRSIGSCSTRSLNRKSNLISMKAREVVSEALANDGRMRRAEQRLTDANLEDRSLILKYRSLQHQLEDLVDEKPALVEKAGKTLDERLALEAKLSEAFHERLKAQARHDHLEVRLLQKQAQIKHLRSAAAERQLRIHDIQRELSAAVSAQDGESLLLHVHHLVKVFNPDAKPMKTTPSMSSMSSPITTIKEHSSPPKEGSDAAFDDAREEERRNAEIAAQEHEAGLKEQARDYMQDLMQQRDALEKSNKKLNQRVKVVESQSKTTRRMRAEEHALLLDQMNDLRTQNHTLRNERDVLITKKQQTIVEAAPAAAAAAAADGLSHAVSSYCSLNIATSPVASSMLSSVGNVDHFDAFQPMGNYDDMTECTVEDDVTEANFCASPSPQNGTQDFGVEETKDEPPPPPAHIETKEERIAALPLIIGRPPNPRAERESRDRASSRPVSTEPAWTSARETENALHVARLETRLREHDWILDRQQQELDLLRRKVVESKRNLVPIDAPAPADDEATVRRRPASMDSNDDDSVTQVLYAKFTNGDYDDSSRHFDDISTATRHSTETRHSVETEVLMRAQPSSLGGGIFATMPARLTHHGGDQEDAESLGTTTSSSTANSKKKKIFKKKKKKLPSS